MSEPDEKVDLLALAMVKADEGKDDESEEPTEDESQNLN